MNRKWIFFVCFILFLPFNSQSKVKSNSKLDSKSNHGLDVLKFKSGMGADVVEAQDLKARIFGYNFQLLLEDKIDSDLSLFFNAQMLLETGSNDVLGTTAEFEPNQSVDLLAGGIRYTPWQGLELSLGALNQGEIESPLLVTNTPFAGVSEKLSFGVFYLKAQQTIPSNNQLSKRLGTVETGTPYFGTETLGMEIKNKSFQFIFEASHFVFKDLSSEIAQNSETLGNTTQGDGGNKTFNYEFEGTNAMTNLKWRNGNHIFLLGGHFLYNEKAPTDRNVGYLSNIGYKYKWYGIFLEDFRNESDTSPSFYNSRYYGHNNIKGNAIILNYKRNSIDCGLRYANIQTIEDSFIQDKKEIFSFRLIKTYDF